MKNIQCEYCGKTREYFQKARAYYQHSCRNKQEVFCKLCNICFKSNQIMRRHVESVHRGVVYPCEECGKVFKTESGLKRHQKSHKEVKELSCEHCGKTFNRKENLKRHNSSCIKEKIKKSEYKCNKCQKIFFRLYHRSNH